MLLLVCLPKVIATTIRSISLGLTKCEATRSRQEHQVDTNLVVLDDITADGERLILAVRGRVAFLTRS